MLLPRLPLFPRQSLLLPPGAGRRNRSPKASTTADRREAAAPLERVLGAAPPEFRSPVPAPRGASASLATGRRGYLSPRPFSAAAPSRHSVTRTLALAPGGAARLQRTQSCRRAHGPRIPAPASEVRAAATKRAARDSERHGSQQGSALSPVSFSAPAPLGEETPGWYGKMDASCGQAQPRPARSAARPWATPLRSPSAVLRSAWAGIAAPAAGKPLPDHRDSRAVVGVGLFSDSIGEIQNWMSLLQTGL